MKEAMRVIYTHTYTVLLVALIVYAAFITARNMANEDFIRYMQQQVQETQSQTIKALDKR